MQAVCYEIFLPMISTNIKFPIICFKLRWSLQNQFDANIEAAICKGFDECKMWTFSESYPPPFWGGYLPQNICRKKSLFEFLAEMCNFWRTKFMLHGCQKQRYDKDFILHLCLNVGEAWWALGNILHCFEANLRWKWQAMPLRLFPNTIYCIFLSKSNFVLWFVLMLNISLWVFYINLAWLNMKPRVNWVLVTYEVDLFTFGIIQFFSKEVLCFISIR